MRFRFAFATACVLALPLWPGAVQSQVNALGFGATRCADIVTSYEPAQRMALFSWTAGYFTGANMAMIASTGRYRDLTGLAPGEVVTRLLHYCGQHPFDIMMTAADGIYFGLPLRDWRAAESAIANPQRRNSR